MFFKEMGEGWDGDWEVGLLLHLRGAPKLEGF